MVALLMLVVALGHFNRVGMAVAGNERILAQYQLDKTQMGLVYSAFLLCYTLAMLPGGWFIDRFGARAALMVLTFGSAVFVALTGCVGLVFRDGPAVWLGLLVVRSLMGVANAPLHPSAARTVYEHVPGHSKSLANGLVTFAACVGIAGTFYGMGALMDRFDWPVAFLICSRLTLVVAIVWTIGTREGRGHIPETIGLAEPPRHALGISAQSVPPGRDATPLDAPPLDAQPSMWRLLGRRSVLCITLSYAALGYFQYLFFYWIEYYFETVEKHDISVARKYSTLVTLAMGVGMVCGGWLADRVPSSFSPRMRRGLVPVCGLCASGVVFELGLLSPDSRLTLAAFAVAAALIGACEGAFWTTVVELGGRYGGTAAGLMNTGGNAGGTLSPTLTPLLSTFFAAHFGESVGWRLSLAVAGAIAVLGAAMWWGVDPPPNTKYEARNPIQA
jgi:MFS family permease